MFFELTPFITLLLANGILAVHSSELGARLAHRHNRRQLGLISRDERPVEYNAGWAGAIHDKTNGTFTTITGTLVIPEVTGPDGDSAAWVGIDGRGCGLGLLQAGIDIRMVEGQAVYGAWSEWYPDNSLGFPNITVSAGDKIRITVTALSTVSGRVVMENLTANQTARKELSSPYTLCMASVEWILEDYMGDSAPLPHFNTVTFTEATATGPSGKSYTPFDAIIAEVQQNGTVYTSVTTEKDTLTIKYI